MATDKSKTVIIPLMQAIAACFFWGALFAVPLFLEEFYSLDIVLGRFFFYGITSLAILAYYIVVHKNFTFLKYYKEATLCAVIMNFVHFTGMTLGIRYASAPLITIIMGISPIAITFVTCFLKRDISLLKTLIWPCLLILVGIVFMNVEVVDMTFSNLSLWEYLMGIFFGLVALGTWVWFVIYNSEFLKKHAYINANQWTALIGFQTLWITLAFMGARYYFLGDLHFAQFHWSHESGRMFLISTLVLGIFCSWVAFALWSAASARISPSLAGQLSILESIFGLALVYSIQFQIPTLMEGIGILFILIAVSWGLYLYVDEPKTESSSTPAPKHEPKHA